MGAKDKRQAGENDHHDHDGSRLNTDRRTKKSLSISPDVAPAAVDPVRAAAAGGTEGSMRLKTSVLATSLQMLSSSLDPAINFSIHQSRWVPKSRLVWEECEEWRVTSRPWTPCGLQPLVARSDASCKGQL